jgi:hypothetical protein
MKSGLVSIGNIPLYSRPVLTVNAEPKTTFSITIFQKPDLTRPGTNSKNTRQHE